MEQPQKSQNHKPFLFPNSTPPKPLNSISISITILLAISLPIFYISLLHISLSNLLNDTTFWFLLSNSIIIIVATDFGAFSSNTDTNINSDIYDEFMLHSKARKQSFMTIVSMEKSLVLSHQKEEKTEERIKRVIVEEDVKKKDVIFLDEKEPLGDSMRYVLKETSEEGCDYWNMSDEELKRRVEEFIRLNRETMLQEARK